MPISGDAAVSSWTSLTDRMRQKNGRLIKEKRQESSESSQGAPAEPAKVSRSRALPSTIATSNTTTSNTGKEPRQSATGKEPRQSATTLTTTTTTSSRGQNKRLSEAKTTNKQCRPRIDTKTSLDRVREFKDEPLKVDNKGNLYCKTCSCILDSVKVSSLRKHFKTNKHLANVERDKQRAEENDRMTNVLKEMQPEALNSAKKKALALRRLRVTRVFLRNAIPLNKIREPELRHLLEENHSSLVKNLNNNIPLVIKDIKDELKKVLECIYIYFLKLYTYVLI